MCDAVCIIARGEKVLDGPIAEVRTQHGGDARGARARRRARRTASTTVLNDQLLVARFDDQNRFFEIELHAGADPQVLLRRLIDAGARDAAVRAGAGRRCTRSSCRTWGRGGWRRGCRGRGSGSGILVHAGTRRGRGGGAGAGGAVHLCWFTRRRGDAEGSRRGCRGRGSGSPLLVHAEARGRGGVEVVDDAVQSVLEHVCSEVDEEANALVHEAKVGQELFAVHRGEPFD